MWRTVPIALLASGCIFDEDDYVSARNRVLCRLQVDCFGRYETEAACTEAQAAEQEPPCVDFRLPVARACVQLLRRQARTCPTDAIASWQPPATCFDVCAPRTVDTDASGDTAGTDVARPLPPPAPGGSP